MSHTDAAREPIERVHVVFKTHLDIGFTDLAARVTERYLNVYIPGAIRTAETLARRGGRERLVWTVGSWLVDEYLRRTEGAAREAAERAIREGVIAWHALPFTTHTELMDRTLAEFALSIARRLDERFGKKTIAAKLTDVPGHTIGLVPVLARAGVEYLHIGVNGASYVPEVPPVFRWVAPGGEEVIVQYSGGYGDTVTVPGLRDALAVVFSADNLGPPTVGQVIETFESLGKRYPGAEIVASTLDSFAEKLLAVRDRLPVVTEEIGDTWIHGIGTDPWKTTRYRELLRLRDRWTAGGLLDPDSEIYRAFCTNLLMIPEHTWGLDLKKHLADYRNWSTPAFRAARERDRVGPEVVPPQFRFIEDHARRELGELFPEETDRADRRSYSFFESSHKEQRQYLDRALEALPRALRTEAESAFETLVPERPERSGGSIASPRPESPAPLMSSAPPESPAPPHLAPARTGFASDGAELVEPGAPVQAGTYTARFGPDGSIVSLVSSSGRELVNGRVGLGAFSRETFGPEEYAAWHRDYNRDMETNAPWALADFGKPGMEYAEPRPIHALRAPIVRRIEVQRLSEQDEFTVEASMPKSPSGPDGAPRSLAIRYRFPRSGAEPIGITLDWFDKEAVRLPEALWISFAPAVENPSRWRLVKLGLEVSPYEVVRGGNRACHAVEALAYEGADGISSIRSLDAPLVSPGERKLLRFDFRFADLEGGMHFCLFDNLWGTNFPMWYEEDARFRFEISLGLR
jgi:hypothetical protein